MGNGFYLRRGKRVVDLVLSAIALVAASPVALLVAIAVRLSMGSPVLFKQVRVGRNNAEFEMFKFRTMRDSVDSQSRLLPDGERVTRTGAFLRSASLDEIPELINVLRGEMSLVGPRPLLPRYLGRYSPTQARRHEVLPGLTGLAQTSGRNQLTWDEQFELDVEYVDSLDLRQDLAIMVRTVGEVLGRDAERSASTSTKPFFDEV